jgi:hypothetical protein
VVRAVSQAGLGPLVDRLLPPTEVAEAAAGAPAGLLGRGSPGSGPAPG